MTTKYAAYRPAASDHTRSPFISGEVESYTRMLVGVTNVCNQVLLTPSDA